MDIRGREEIGEVVHPTLWKIMLLRLLPSLQISEAFQEEVVSLMCPHKRMDKDENGTGGWVTYPDPPLLGYVGHGFEGFPVARAHGFMPESSFKFGAGSNWATQTHSALLIIKIIYKILKNVLEYLVCLLHKREYRIIPIKPIPVPVNG